MSHRSLLTLDNKLGLDHHSLFLPPSLRAAHVTGVSIVLVVCFYHRRPSVERRPVVWMKLFRFLSGHVPGSWCRVVFCLDVPGAPGFVSLCFYRTVVMNSPLE